jgi:hypothetical protein
MNKLLLFLFMAFAISVFSQNKTIDLKQFQPIANINPNSIDFVLLESYYFKANVLMSIDNEDAMIWLKSCDSIITMSKSIEHSSFNQYQLYIKLMSLTKDEN